MKILSGFLLIFLGTLSSAQVKQIEIVPRPSWVKDFSYKVGIRDTTNTSGGYYDLLTESQYNIRLRESFHHFAQQIISEKGLENVSSISQTFDPSWEKLLFHSIEVIRGGTRINQLQLGEFQILKREQNLERLIYDGNLTAVFNLYDLQVGDIIDYSYSIRGSNPAYRGKYSNLAYLNFSAPVGMVVKRFITAANHPYAVKKFNAAPEPQVDVIGDSKIYTWVANDVPALLSEESTPGWFDPYDHVQLSDFGSWKDLSGWASDLFKVEPADANLLRKIPGLDGRKKDEAIQAAIEFVQDEIRYLSFSEGIHGYQPHAPSKILNQRFGDCKDKSFLLATLLMELGVSSEPVLVNTTYGKALADYLPAPYLFNHCIVRFTLNDSTFWVDPTISLQGGDFRKMNTPKYHFGAVVSRAVNDLIAMPGNVSGELWSKEDYYVHSIGGDATLDVKTVYSGDEADNMRSYFKSNSLAYVQKQFLNFYATDFADVKEAEQMKWQDNESSNKLEVVEKYEIQTFWQFDSTKSMYSVSMYPRNLASYLVKPTIKIRHSPYSLRYPTNVVQEIVVHLPEGWSVTPGEKTIECAAFQYKSSISYSENNIYLKYSFRMKKPHLEAAEVRDYIAKIDDTSNDLTFNITRKIGSAADASINFPYLVIMLFALGGCFYGALVLFKLDPEPKPAIQKYNSIGGWLLLPAIGLCLSPFLYLAEIINTDYFNYTNWQIMMDPEYGAYNPTLGLFVLLELLANTVLMIYVVFVAYMFFQRRSSVPMLAAIFYVTSATFIGLDAWIGTAYGVEVDSDTTKTIVRSLVAAMVWAPYFLVSERSKGTFTVRRKPPLDPDMQTVYRRAEETA